jgi:RNA polymerase sigma-70 factor (ECF subfamily)
MFEDEARFRDWYEFAARRLYRYLFGRCGGDVAMAEELTQQTFLQAVRHRDAYDGRSDATTWLISIGRNLLIDNVRRLDREERRHLRLVVREITPVGGEDKWQLRDERELILDALRRMPAGQRAALVLHHVDGLPVRDVARALGRSEGAVEQLLSRGRARCRELYEEADHG